MSLTKFGKLLSYYCFHAVLFLASFGDSSDVKVDFLF